MATQKQSQTNPIITLGIIVVIGIVIFLNYQWNSFQKAVNAPSSGKSQYERTMNQQNAVTNKKICSYCGKEYSGNGYHIVFGECTQSKEYGSKCSAKCCYENAKNDPALKGTKWVKR